ncbi:MAG: 4-(cytidine 5'-diphospho)-2-C-methyl-D-erythritol kinase [Clostridiales bacterium]|nr:4-(cytidine 5'-diphospho)-2-C-methyl-D-erythritol kinase [Clostridiales bacterium]
MSETLYEISAYAKINLFLKILGKLPNGYHQLYTIMQEVDLADEITVAVDEEAEDTITVQDPEGKILSEDNLCHIAARKFLGYMGRKYEGTVFPKITITLEKNIPAQSGMGGGSSDAAAVLLVLQEHFGKPFTDEELNGLAVSIGADVPFFLYGGTCLCENVGEEITVLRSLAGGNIVLVKPSEGVSTAECFKMADRSVAGEDQIAPFRDITERLRSGSEECGLPEFVEFLGNCQDSSNDLQGPAEEMVPEISALLSELTANGARVARMTGSGSAVFGIFDDEEDQASAYDNIRRAHEKDGTEVYRLKTI